MLSESQLVPSFLSTVGPYIYENPLRCAALCMENSLVVAMGEKMRGKDEVGVWG